MVRLKYFGTMPTMVRKDAQGEKFGVEPDSAFECSEEMAKVYTATHMFEEVGAGNKKPNGVEVQTAPPAAESTPQVEAKGKKPRRK